MREKRPFLGGGGAWRGRQGLFMWRGACDSVFFYSRCGVCASVWSDEEGERVMIW